MTSHVVTHLITFDICFADSSLSGNIMAMDQCLDILKSSFLLINEDICSYVQSVLETSGEDFECSDDLFEAVGEVLQEVDGEKTESEIQKICEVLYRTVKPGQDRVTEGGGKLKLLETSVQLGQLAAEQHNGAEVGRAHIDCHLTAHNQPVLNFPHSE